MNTDLIDSLAAELRPRKKAPSLLGYLLRWSVGVVLITVLALSILTLRPDLNLRIVEARFWIETIALFTASAVSAAVVYLSSIPARLSPRNRRLGWLALAMVVAILLLRFQNEAFFVDFSSEITIYRGGCGLFILTVGIVASGILFALIRKHASTRPGFTGVWAAVSAGCFGSFLMQFVCQYENAAHLFIWHFLPLVILAILGLQTGRKFLRW